MSKVSPGRLYRLATEQDGRCAYCRELFGEYEEEANPTIDHVVARANGGKNNDANLVAACARCNTVKGSMGAEEFCALIDAGGLRPRKNFSAAHADLGIRRQQRAELRAALAAFHSERPSKVGPQNPPFSKNKPLRRLYRLDAVPVEPRDWDEDRRA